ncbi:hypothetical protein AX16_006135 [Volvariella volvacea WC 439]|nr:hypothetical protein AX16_006135 [Volvariella volvacea WC 439]
MQKGYSTNIVNPFKVLPNAISVLISNAVYDEQYTVAKRNNQEVDSTLTQTFLELLKAHTTPYMMNLTGAEILKAQNYLEKTIFMSILDVLEDWIGNHIIPKINAAQRKLPVFHFFYEKYRGILGSLLEVFKNNTPFLGHKEQFIFGEQPLNIAAAKLWAPVMIDHGWALCAEILKVVILEYDECEVNSKVLLSWIHLLQELDQTGLELAVQEEMSLAIDFRLNKLRMSADRGTPLVYSYFKIPLLKMMQIYYEDRAQMIMKNGNPVTVIAQLRWWLQLSDSYDLHHLAFTGTVGLERSCKLNSPNKQEKPKYAEELRNVWIHYAMFPCQSYLIINSSELLNNGEYPAICQLAEMLHIVQEGGGSEMLDEGMRGPSRYCHLNLSGEGNMAEPNSREQQEVCSTA